MALLCRLLDLSDQLSLFEDSQADAWRHPAGSDSEDGLVFLLTQHRTIAKILMAAETQCQLTATLAGSLAARRH